MDEKDKMLRQMVYHANDAVLNEDRMKCKDLCYEFNIVKPSQDRKSTRLNSSHSGQSRMPSSA